MSLQPQTGYQIPEEAQRVARAALPKGTLCLRIADALGAIYHDSQFAALFPTRGNLPKSLPAWPWRRSCHWSRGCRIGGRRRPYAGASTGNRWCTSLVDGHHDSVGIHAV